ncbi:MAG: Na(+)/H(+) antiporter subunit D [bacterium]
MIAINELPPGLILIVGALFVPLLKGHLRNLFVILLPVLGFYYIYQLESNALVTLPFLKYELTILRVDKLSKAFGYIFTLSAFAAFIYGYYEKRSTQFVAALMYVGSSLGVIFAGDLFTLYICWESMAVTSVYLILARKTEKSMAAGIRYLLVHIFGGLVLLAGIVMTVHQSGSIAFNSFATVTPGTVLILVGFLINAAAFPFSTWLPDSYPEATAMGGVILSAYTSKTAVYALIRGFPGWEILVFAGCLMAIYGIIYALLENDMRRILGYSIINQVGFMVCAVGIGSTLALNGAVAHAFTHIAYKALLWMSAGAVLYRVGKSKCTELGGLYQTMPWSLIFGAIGALSISSVPLTSGYTSKTIILLAAENEHLVWVWLILEIASAGVFLHAGIKFPYFVFFGKDSGLRPKETDKSMLIGMGILAFICIYLGCFPGILYDILPDTEIVKSHMPHTFGDIYVGNFAHVVTQLQLLLFSGLVFFLFLPLLKRTDTISIDIDWIYRKGGGLFYRTVDRGLNGINDIADKILVAGLTATIAAFVRNAPAQILYAVLTPIWVISGVGEADRAIRKQKLFDAISQNTLPIGLAAAIGVLLLGGLFFL